MEVFAQHGWQRNLRIGPPSISTQAQSQSIGLLLPNCRLFYVLLSDYWCLAVCILIMQRPGDTLNALYLSMLHLELIKAPFIKKMRYMEAAFIGCDNPIHFLYFGWPFKLFFYLYNISMSCFFSLVRSALLEKGCNRMGISYGLDMMGKVQEIVCEF